MRTGTFFFRCYGLMAPGVLATIFIDKTVDSCESKIVVQWNFVVGRIKRNKFNYLRHYLKVQLRNGFPSVNDAIVLCVSPLREQLSPSPWLWQRIKHPFPPWRVSKRSNYSVVVIERVNILWILVDLCGEEDWQRFSQKCEEIIIRNY